jgi:hypothetical protein
MINSISLFFASIALMQNLSQFCSYQSSWQSMIRSHHRQHFTSHDDIDDKSRDTPLYCTDIITIDSFALISHSQKPLHFINTAKCPHSTCIFPLSAYHDARAAQLILPLRLTRRITIIDIASVYRDSLTHERSTGT